MFDLKLDKVQTVNNMKTKND